MKKVITYGTFDLLHDGHLRLLKRAKKLGDYLIVGITTENYDKQRGKVNVKDSLVTRIENVKATGLADEIIIEEYIGQKIDDIQRLGVDIFTVGSDWRGQFEYLKEYCEVIYLERTRGVSSTLLRSKEHPIIRLGIIGNGRIANRFISEAKYVSGVNVEGVFNINLKSAEVFAEKHTLRFATDNLENFFSEIDAVYIASPHLTHYDYTKKSLEKLKHVLCEKPLVLDYEECSELYDLAEQKNLVLLEAIKTAYSPCFSQMISIVKSGDIGEIVDVEASFTKLTTTDCREMNCEKAGGSVNELASYPLMAIIKLLGCEYENINFYSKFKNNIDIFTRGVIGYKNAVASFKVGLGVKTEGDMTISGTTGYIYVPAPWWKTEYFEIRRENSENNEKYYQKFAGDGLRYELGTFVSLIFKSSILSHKLKPKESKCICKIISNFNQKENTTCI